MTVAVISGFYHIGNRQFYERRVGEPIQKIAKPRRIFARARNLRFHIKPQKIGDYAGVNGVQKNLLGGVGAFANIFNLFSRISTVCEEKPTITGAVTEHNCS